MKRFESLEEVRECGREWADIPTRIVRKIDPEEVFNLYMAAMKYVPERIKRYAESYGFPNFEQGYIVFGHGFAGRCIKQKHILIDFFTVLFTDDVYFDHVLLHELCHTVHPHHKPAFWKLLDEKLRETSVVPSDYDGWNREVTDSPHFDSETYDGYSIYESPGKVYPVSTIKRCVIRTKIFSKKPFWRYYKPIVSPDLWEKYRSLYGFAKKQRFLNGFYWIG